MLVELSTEIERKQYNETVEEYERDTGKKWTEIEEKMFIICQFYDYSFLWNAEGNICINIKWDGKEYNGENIYSFLGHDIEDLNNHVNHYEYENAASMVKAWEDICKMTNDDYKKNGNKKPFICVYTVSQCRGI